MATHAEAVVAANESDIHDEPHLRGRRVTVRTVHAAVETQDQRPETVADELDVPLADVYHALAYYHDHPEEMRDVAERRRRVHELATEDPDVATGPSDAPSGP